MSKDLNPNQYQEAVKGIYSEALQAATNLLKEKNDKCYIAFSDWECETDAYYDNSDCTVSIFGVGLNENGNLCVAAVVNNIGYGHGPDDFPQSWTEASELKPDCYPDIYWFVAMNIDKCITKEEADKVAKGYWYVEDDESENESENEFQKAWNDAFADEDEEDETEKTVYPAELVIDSESDEISEEEYSNHEEIETVVMPDNVTVICDCAFYKCKNLKSVKFSKNLTEIQSGAFAYCESLLEIELPEGLETLGGGDFFTASSFQDCISLKTVIIPSSIKSIENAVFEGCENIESVTIKKEDPSSIEMWDCPFSETILDTCKLIVPAESVDAYKQHEFFGNFKNIVSI